MAILGIQTVGVAVRDVKLIARFFYEKLGCEIKFNSNPMQTSASIYLGDNSFILYQVSNCEEPIIRNLDVSINPRGIDHVAIKCENLNFMYHEMMSKGVVFNGQPQFYPKWGFELVSFFDPEGNSYYLLEEIG